MRPWLHTEKARFLCGAWMTTIPHFTSSGNFFDVSSNAGNAVPNPWLTGRLATLSPLPHLLRAVGSESPTVESQTGTGKSIM